MMPMRLALCLVIGDTFKREYKLAKTHGLRMGCYNILLSEAFEKLVAIGSLHVPTTPHTDFFVIVTEVEDHISG